jgi:hypothetical protein
VDTLGEPVSWLDASGQSREASQKPGRAGRYFVTDTNGESCFREWDGRRWAQPKTRAVEFI